MKCPGCSRDGLVASDFGVNNSRKSGLQRLCKQCKRAANKRDYKKNKARQKRYNKAVSLTMRKVAHTIVARAFRSFELEPRPCEVCETTENVVGHHDDYSKPLTVRWLCRTHHKAWHDENGPGENHDKDGEALAEEYGRPRRSRTDDW